MSHDQILNTQALDSIRVEPAEMEKIAPGFQVLFGFDKASGRLTVVHTAANLTEILREPTDTTQFVDLPTDTTGVMRASACCDGEPYCCWIYWNGKWTCVLCQ